MVPPEGLTVQVGRCGRARGYSQGPLSRVSHLYGRLRQPCLADHDEPQLTLLPKSCRVSRASETTLDCTFAPALLSHRRLARCARTNKRAWRLVLWRPSATRCGGRSLRAAAGQAAERPPTDRPTDRPTDSCRPTDRPIRLAATAGWAPATQHGRRARPAAAGTPQHHNTPPPCTCTTRPSPTSSPPFLLWLVVCRLYGVDRPASAVARR